MGKMLVTGGAGFIGGNFVHTFHNKYNITVLDALTYCGRRENLKGTKHKFIHGDVRDEKLVDSIIKGGINSIIHFAASTHVDRSIKTPMEFISVDIFGTAVLLEAARKYDIECFVMISTDEVYGSIKRGSFSETSPFRPSSPYSASKASADLICQSYSRTYGLPITIVRPSNNFGPMQFPEKLIPRFITLALQNKKLPIFGSGLQKREWLYVLDCVKAIEIVMRKGKKGEAYNIGGGRKNEKTNLWIAEFILRELGKPASLVEFVRDRPGHDFRYSMGSRKIKKMGWRPRFGLNDALKETIKWYATNASWWKPVMGKRDTDSHQKW